MLVTEKIAKIKTVFKVIPNIPWEKHCHSRKNCLNSTDKIGSHENIRLLRGN